jgi:MFS transporter, ACS family, aldohexuronate transporter
MQCGVPQLALRKRTVYVAPHVSRSPQHDQRVVLTLVMLAQLLSPLVGYSIGALAPFLRLSLTLTWEQLGGLTACFYAGAALAAIPAGWGADRLGVRRLFVAALALGGLPLLTMPWVHTYGPLRLVLGCTGLGYGSMTVVTGKALYAWFPVECRATAFGAKLLALSLSGVLTSAVGPVLALWLGWRWLFLGMGGLLLGATVGTWCLYREPAPAVASPGTVGWRLLLRHGPFWRVVTVGGLFGGTQFAFLTYLPLFLHEHWGLSPVLAATLLAQAQLAAACNRILTGWVSDRWLQGDRWPLLRGLGGVAAGAVLLLLPPGTAYPALVASVLLFGASGLSWGSIHHTLASELAGAAVGGGGGISIAAVYAGSTLSALLFGAVVDTTGTYTGAWGLLLGCLFGGVLLLGRGRPYAWGTPSRVSPPEDGHEKGSLYPHLPPRHRPPAL